MGLYDEELGINKDSNTATVERSGGLFDEEINQLHSAKPVTPKPVVSPNITQQVVNPGLKNKNGNGYAVNPSVNDVTNSEPMYAKDGLLNGIISLTDNRRYNDRFAGQDRYSSLSAYNAKHAKNGTNKGIGFRLGQIGHGLYDAFVGTPVNFLWKDPSEDLRGLGELASMAGKGIKIDIDKGWNLVSHPKQTFNNLKNTTKDIKNNLESIDYDKAAIRANPILNFYNTAKELVHNSNELRRSELGHSFQEALKEQYGQGGMDMVRIGQNGKPIQVNVDIPGFLQSVHAHPFNTLLDFGSFGAIPLIKHVSKINKAKKYLKASGNAGIADKVKNATIGALDKATSTNPNIADKVSKAADAFGYDASKLNDTTSKMHEFNKLVEEGKSPKYSDVQEKAIEHSKLANQEQSSKLIDELTHGVEEQNVKPNETVEDLKQDELSKFLDEYEQPKETNASLEPPEKSTSHVEEDLGKNIPEEPKTIQEEAPIEPAKKQQKTNVEAEENAKRNGDVDTTLPPQEPGKIVRRRKKDGTISVTKGGNKWIKYKKQITSGMAEGADTLQRNVGGENNVFKNIDNTTNKPDTLVNHETYNNKLIEKLKKQYTTLEDPQTNSYILINKKTGKRVSGEDINKLRERLRKNYNSMIIDSDIDKDVDKFMKSIFSEEDVFDDITTNATEAMSPSRQIKEGLWTHEPSERTTRYTDDMSPEFKQWYEEYSKSSPQKQKEMLNKKINSFDTLNDAEDFVTQFSNVEYLDNMRLSAKNSKIGGEKIDIDDVSSTEKLTNAISENQDAFNNLKRTKNEGDNYTNQNTVRWANSIWENILHGSSNKKTTWSKSYKKSEEIKWVANNTYDVKEGLSRWFAGKSGVNKDAQKGIQNLYNKTATRILNDERIPANVKEVMLNQLDEAVDYYFDKHWSKKPWNVDKEIPTIKKYDGLRDAKSLKAKQEKDFIKLMSSGKYDAAGYELVKSNIKYEYASDEAKKYIDKYFEHRLDSMNNILFIDKNGKPDFKKILNAAVKNKEKGMLNFFNRTKNSIRRPQNLNSLSNDEKIKILDDAFDRYQNALNKNKNIIATDLKKYAYSDDLMNNKKQFNQNTGKYENIGDSWNRESSGVLNSRDVENLIDRQISKYQKLIDDYKLNIDKVKTNMSLEDIAKNYFDDIYNKAGQPNLSSEKIAQWATEGLHAKHGLHPDLISDFDKALASAKKNFAKDYQKRFLSGKDENIVDLEKRLKELDAENINNIDGSNSINLDSIGRRLGEVIDGAKNIIKGDYGKVKDLRKTNQVFNFLTDHIKDFDDYSIINVDMGIANGRHLNGRNTILLNMNNFDSPDKMIKTVAHEFEHAKQEQEYKNVLKIKRSERTLEDWKIVKNYEDCRKANDDFRLVYGSSDRPKMDRILAEAYKHKGIDAKKDFIRNLSSEDIEVFTRFRDAYKKYKNTPNEFNARKVGKHYAEKYTEWSNRTGNKITSYGLGGNNRRRLLLGNNGKRVRSVEDADIRNSQASIDFDGIPEQPKSVADSKPVEHTTVSKNDLKDVDFGDTYNGNKARKYVAETSKDTEDTLIELGLLDKEQAANRLKQQSSKTGEDKAYFKGKRNTKDSIDIDKDYNALTNSKEGLFGKKTKDGISEVGTAEDVTRQEINRNLHAHYTKNTTDYVANNFALPIENGKIKDGYIGVNRTLLNNMVHGRFSSEWYKTLEAGEETIRKSFKDEGVANAWVELSKKTQNHDFQIPKAVFDTLADGSAENAAVYWDRYARFDNPRGLAKGVGKFVGALNDALLNGFKRRVLASGSFVLNNRLGNQILIYNTSKNPVEYLKSFYGASKLKDTDVPIELLQSNIAEAAKDSLVRRTYTGYNALDNAINLFNGQLIDTKNLAGMKKNLAKGANIIVGYPNKWFNKLSETVMKFNDKFERFERKQKFAQAMDKERVKLIKQTGQIFVKDSEVLKHINGNSEITEAVIREVEDALGNYRTFNKFEKNVLKRFIPFYSWYRTITRHTLKLATTHPEKIARLRLELMAIGIDNRGDYSKKKYQRHSVDIGEKDKRSGKVLVINKEHGNPYNTFREDIGYNPYLTTLNEMRKGKKNFLDGEITNDRYVRQTNYDGGDRKTGYYDVKENDWVRDNKGKIKYDEDYNNGFIKGALPKSTRLGYGLKTLAKNTVAPYIDNSLINIEQLGGALDNKLTKNINKKEKGNLIPYDKNYDASIGGYNNGDIVGVRKTGKYKKIKKISRFASNDLSPKNKAMNMLGLGIQNKADLNKAEREEYREKTKRIRKRMRKSK